MSYLTLNPRKLKNRIQKCVNILTPLKNNFDSIAFMGISGALVAPAVASELGKHLIAVRKEKTRHSTHNVEVGFKKPKNYIIIDDFVDSGSTIKSIVQNIQRRHPQAKLFEYLMYNPYHKVKLHLEKYPQIKGIFIR
jgi:adenine/guanine phosphoribosyltransferase-like PRPP-binding protein